jgi:fumarylpyruvate hydrolase
MDHATSNYVISPPEQAVVPVQGGGLFPVHRIYCVGRNYAAHTIEMGGDPDREEPFFFQKNPDNLVTGGADFPYPDKSSDVHHEIELAVALGRGGRNIPIERALDCVWGYAVALDMTRRDLQGECKKAGRPWEIGKAFDRSAPCSDLVPATEIDHPSDGAIWLKVNGETRQEGDLNHMIWKVPEMIAYLSGLFELAPGDIILSGTPSGVGPVRRGDVLHGHVDRVGSLHCRVV